MGLNGCFLLGGFLAPALFQTLIVTWIKANLNVAVKPELWQNFMELLTHLTHWEDLIKEWAVRILRQAYSFNVILLRCVIVNPANDNI